MRRRFIFCQLFALGLSALNADVGDVLATAETPAEFEVYTSDNAVYAATSVAALEELLPIYCLAGDVITATAYDGTIKTISEGLPSDGPIKFTPDKGGIWTLVNSKQEVARIGVSWDLYDGVGTELSDSTHSSLYAVETVQSGPNRKVKKIDVLPLAYTADKWINYAPGAVKLLITAPDGIKTDLNLSGSGAEKFSFNRNGDWNLLMTMADGTQMSSTVTIIGGVALLVR